MSILATCGSCSATYNVADSMAGKKVRCKACQGVIAVPTNGASTPAVVSRVASAKPQAVKVAARPAVAKSVSPSRSVAAAGSGISLGFKDEEHEPVAPPPPVKVSRTPAPKAPAKAARTAAPKPAPAPEPEYDSSDPYALAEEPSNEYDLNSLADMPVQQIDESTTYTPPAGRTKAKPAKSGPIALNYTRHEAHVTEPEAWFDGMKGLFIAAVLFAPIINAIITIIYVKAKMGANVAIKYEVLGGQIVGQIGGVVIVGAPLILLSVWIASRMMKFPIVSGAYSTALACAGPGQIIGLISLVMMLFIGEAATLPLVVMAILGLYAFVRTLKGGFGMTWLQTLVAMIAPFLLVFLVVALVLIFGRVL